MDEIEERLRRSSESVRGSFAGAPGLDAPAPKRTPDHRRTVVAGALLAVAALVLVGGLVVVVDRNGDDTPDVAAPPDDDPATAAVTEPTAATTEPPASTDPPPPPPDPVLVYEPSQDESPADGIEGTLAFEAGCLLLQVAGGGSSYPVVWPSTAAWQADPAAVVIGADVFLMGESVLAGGAFVDRTVIEQVASPETAAAAAACADPSEQIILIGAAFPVVRADS